MQVVIHFSRISFGIAVLLHSHEQCCVVFDHYLVESWAAILCGLCELLGNLVDIPQALRNIPIAHELLFVEHMLGCPINATIRRANQQWRLDKAEISMLEITFTHDLIYAGCPRRKNSEIKIRSLLILLNHHHVQCFDSSAENIRYWQIA